MYLAMVTYGLVIAFTATCLLRATRTLRKGSVEPRTLSYQVLDLHVILPAYLEAEIIGETLSHYSPLLGQHLDRIVLLLSAGDVSTASAVATWRAANTSAAESVDLVVCAPACDSKSTKLQHYWTAARLRDGSEEFLGRLFCIFDIDARPDTELFEGLSNRASPRSTGAHIWQAVPVTIPSLSGLLADALALAQAERTAMECWALDKWSGRGNRPMLLGLMGAAMALNGRAVDLLAPWPAFSDDIQIGYRSDVLGIPRTLVPVRVPVQGTFSFKDWWSQQLRIAVGVQTRLQECSRDDSTIRPSAVGRALLSVAFDWTPAWRLMLAIITLGYALPAYPAISLGVLATLVGVPLVCFQNVAIARRRTLTGRTLALAIVGGLAWAPLRACAGVVALLSQHHVLKTIMKSALAGRSGKR